MAIVLGRFLRGFYFSRTGARSPLFSESDFQRDSLVLGGVRYLLVRAFSVCARHVNRQKAEDRSRIAPPSTQVSSCGTVLFPDGPFLSIPAFVAFGAYPGRWVTGI